MTRYLNTGQRSPVNLIHNGHDLACECPEGPCHRDVLIDIANPPPPASRVLPVTLLTISFIVSLLLVIGSFIYLIAKAREHRPVPPPVMFPRK